MTFCYFSTNRSIWEGKEVHDRLSNDIFCGSSDRPWTGETPSGVYWPHTLTSTVVKLHTTPGKTALWSANSTHSSHHHLTTLPNVYYWLQLEYLQSVRPPSTEVALTKSLSAELEEPICVRLYFCLASDGIWQTSLQSNLSTSHTR